MLSDKERNSVLERLAASRQQVIDAVHGLTPEQASWKPSPDRWSILEYLEHLAISDDALVGMVKTSLNDPPQHETPDQRKAREAKIRQTEAPRGTNKAPDALQPKGRFHSIDEALAAFLAARERTIEYARTTQDDLRAHFTPHSVFGNLDGYQWLGGNAHHAESHAGHIQELRAQLPQKP